KPAGRGRAWLAVGFLWLAVLGFFWPLITPDQAARRYFATGDFTVQMFPFHAFAAGQLAAGRLPLWDPYMYSGYPFQADIQTAVLYPIAALNELIGGARFSFLALEWEAIVHFGLAATFTFLLVRLLTGSVLSGLVAAIAFTFGGFLTSYPSQSLPVLESTVWLPLALYFIERAARLATGRLQAPAHAPSSPLTPAPRPPPPAPPRPAPGPPALRTRHFPRPPPPVPGALCAPQHPALRTRHFASRVRRLCGPGHSGRTSTDRPVRRLPEPGVFPPAHSLAIVVAGDLGAAGRGRPGGGSAPAHTAAHGCER